MDAIDSGDNIITIIAEHDEMLKAEKHISLITQWGIVK